MFEFLGILIEVTYVTLTDLIYELFVHPFQVLYHIVMQYIIENNLDPVSILGLCLSIFLLDVLCKFVVNSCRRFIHFCIFSYRKKMQRDLMEKLRQKQKKQQQWEADNREFDEIYEKYVTSNTSIK